MRETFTTFPHRWSAKEREEGKPTDEVRVIRREFIVQLDGVRLVDGVPERVPASNDGFDVFRVGSPGVGVGRDTRGPPTRLLAGVKDLDRVKRTAHLRELVRRPAFTSSSSAYVSSARAPIACTWKNNKNKTLRITET
jgi:hypothetical protein